MSELKIRERRKRADGGYDIIHRETRGVLVKLENGTTVQNHADALITESAGAHGLQIQTTEPATASTDAQVTSSKRLWTMMGAALSTLKTTAKTITGAINELVDGKEPVITTKGTAFNRNFGSAANTVCEGNDGRLSNARTPTAHNHTAGDVNAGTFVADRIPNLDAGKTTTGTFNADRIPSLPSSKITGLSTVATSGSYNDLSNQPTIPSVVKGTGTLTTTGWTASGGAFTQTMTLTGITTSHFPTAGLNASTTVATARNEEIAWNLIGKVEVSAANQLRFTCYNTQPLTAIPVTVMGVA